MSTNGPSVERLVADLAFLLDIHLHQVHGNVAGSLDHHLAVVRPRFLGQLAQRLQLGKLGLVVGVGEATGTQTVAQAPGHVVGVHDLAQLIEVRVPEVLLVMGQHPRAHERPAAADDAGDAVGSQRQILLQDTRMDRHVIDALLGLVLDHSSIIRGGLFGILDILNDLIDGHCADGTGERR
jgi:hypothetical protein